MFGSQTVSLLCGNIFRVNSIKIQEIITGEGQLRHYTHVEIERDSETVIEEFIV